MLLYILPEKVHDLCKGCRDGERPSGQGAVVQVRRHRLGEGGPGFLLFGFSATQGLRGTAILTSEKGT